MLAAVRRVLRPGGRFVVNAGGEFAGVTHPDAQTRFASPSLGSLIDQIAARDYGTPPAPASGILQLPLTAVTSHLADAGLTLVGTNVTAQHTTMAERRTWLSVPVFARLTGASPTTSRWRSRRRHILRPVPTTARSRAGSPSLNLTELRRDEGKPDRAHRSSAGANGTVPRGQLA
jgi:hypothetical protein